MSLTAIRRDLTKNAMDTVLEAVKEANILVNFNIVTRVTKLAEEFGYLYGKQEGYENLVRAKDDVIRALQDNIGAKEELIKAQREQITMLKQQLDAAAVVAPQVKAVIRETKQRSRANIPCRNNNDCPFLIAGRVCQYKHTEEQQHRAKQAKEEAKAEANQKCSEILRKKK